jgi:allophanate hydrolase subunit 2
MTPELRVLAPGLLTTVQDLGRTGYQRLGIAVGGALDPLSLRAANALVGNTPGAGALEVAYVGPTLQVDAEEVRLLRDNLDENGSDNQSLKWRPVAKS